MKSRSLIAAAAVLALAVGIAALARLARRDGGGAASVAPQASAQDAFETAEIHRLGEGAPAERRALAPEPSTGSEGARDAAPGLLAVLALSGGSRRPLAGVPLALRSAEPDPEPTWTRHVKESHGGPARAPETGEDGRATFDVPPGGDWWLEVESPPEGHGKTRLRVAAFAAGENREVVLELPALSEHLLSGRVVSDSDGSPIAEAGVRVVEPEGFVFRPGSTPEPGLLARARTGADGHFQIAVPPRQETALVVDGPGFGPTIAIPVPRGRGSELLLRLIPCAELDVVVTDAAGPVPDVEVRCSVEPYDLVQPGEEPEDLPPEPFEWSRVTELDGSARIDCAPARVRIALEVVRNGDVLHAELLPLVLEPGERREIEIRLDGGALVEGRLAEPDGSPVGGREIWLLLALSDRRHYFQLGDVWLSRMEHRSARTDEKGRFAFEGIPDGLWWVGPAPADEFAQQVSKAVSRALAQLGMDLAQEAGMPPGVGDLDLESGLGSWGVHQEEPAAAVAPLAEPLRVASELPERYLELRAHRGLFVAGRAVGEDGDPVAGVPVKTVALGGVEGWFHAESAADGAFVIGPLAPGTFEVGALERKGFVPLDRPMTVREGTLDLLLRVRTQGTGTLVVRLRSDSGVPAGRSRVSLAAAGDAFSSAFSYFRGASGEGEVTFPDLPPGAYDVVARTPAGEVGVAGGVRVQASRETAVDVLVGPGARLRLRYVGKEFRGVGVGVSSGTVTLDGFGMEPGDEYGVTVPPGEVRVATYLVDAGGELELVWETALLVEAGGDELVLLEQP